MKRSPRTKSAVLAALLLLAAAAARAGEESPAKDERRLRPDHTPTPYTAAEIREACSPGRTATFRMETMGRPARLETMRFVDGDEAGAVIESSKRSLEGKLLGEPSRIQATWRQLQAHGSFRAACTKVSEGRVETPAGGFDCLVYEVTMEKDGRTVVRRLHFAKELPGPPVLLTYEIDGKRVSTMRLESFERGGGWEELTKLLTKQLEMAGGTWEALRKHGVTEETKLALEFYYYSGSRAAAEALCADFEKKRLACRVENLPDDEAFAVVGKTAPRAFTFESLRAWVEDMVRAGFARRCAFDGFGAGVPD